MYAKDFLDKISDTKKKNASGVLNETTKNAMVGASVGGGIGLLIGMVKKQNFLLSIFIGSIIGAGVSTIIKKK